MLAGGRHAAVWTGVTCMRATVHASLLLGRRYGWRRQVPLISQRLARYQAATPRWHRATLPYVTMHKHGDSSCHIYILCKDSFISDDQLLNANCRIVCTASVGQQPVVWQPVGIRHATLTADAHLTISVRVLGESYI
jgi:hypothetical protein